MKLRPISHEERLSVVDHLDELRNRLIVCGIAVVIAFFLCFWQNNALLNLLNNALPHDANSALTNTDKQNRVEENLFSRIGADAQLLSRGLTASRGVSPLAVAGAQALAHDATQAGRQLPKVIASEKSKPLTIGVGETFTSTLTVAAYFALLITLPLILYQIYAFVLPALKPEERRAALPAMIAAPVLFTMGVVFTYFEVLPPAIHFLQGYNANQFYVLVQAGSYYKFEVLLMLGIGLAFQVPLLLLALQKLGVITASSLTGNWRYAIVIIAVVVAALPGVDPVTMTAETVPLLALYLASIGLLHFVEYRTRRREAALPADPEPERDLDRV
ncbi:twin-arginine translocase subunit TatC [Conexibacter sp. DBS9H8]|uniref:twin-arginine translocase subunit TatC n=1 Tax=Conexibacter sp. DBS9H8 TaxID=2937801 RepID=UPI00200FAD8E|nr:twin-arginine translocase subunit TatC [Conexibacter sp. DBS9H8]